MAEKRNPTKHTEERSGRDSSDGPPELPEDAERAEYADYNQEDTAEKGGSGEAEADRESDLQPGGNPDKSIRDG